MDAITDFLSAVRVQGVCYGRIQITASWTPPSEAESHARFGSISYGQAWLSLPDVAEPVYLMRGDFFLLAPGREFVLSAAEAARPPRSLPAGSALTRPMADRSRSSFLR